jgi:hypothetical protein
MFARFAIVAAMTIFGAQCVLGADKQLDPLREILRAESRGLAELCKKRKPGPLNRPPVGELARAQAVLGDLEGAMKTASIQQGTGDRAMRARFEALVDVAGVVAQGGDFGRTVSIVEGAGSAVKVRVLLSFAAANAKRRVPSVKGALKLARVLAQKFKRRARINVLNRIAVIESKTGDAAGSLKTCMQALGLARKTESPRERVWTFTSIAKALADAGHAKPAAKLVAETLSVIEKISGMQSEEIKTDAKSDLAMILDKTSVSQKTADQRLTESIKKLLSAGEYTKALDEVKSFKNNEVGGESMLRIASWLARNGDKKKAWEIVDGVEGYVSYHREYLFKWFDLRKPNTWINSWDNAEDKPMRIRIAVAAIPLWYELEYESASANSPLELIDSHRLDEDWNMTEALVLADVRYGDLNVVMDWVEAFLKSVSPGESSRIAFFTTIADQAVKRSKDPPRIRRKKTPTTAPAVVSISPPAVSIFTPADPIILTKVDDSPPAVLRRQLAKQFDTIIDAKKSYQTRVSKECKRFPEGDIFPYTLPAIAYANIALADPLRRTNSLERMRGLLDSAVASTVARVKPPAGKLELLKSYKKHATYLGQLNMALGYYRLIGGDKRYDAINKAISDALHKALVELKGRPLASFPVYSWTFDTIPVLVSLKLYDHNTYTDRSSAVIRQHLDWMRTKGIHKSTKLPYSRISAAGKPVALPRGCDLSWRISMIAQLDARLAKTMYDDYVKSFWIDRKIVSGFAEWPGGKAGKQDADSGPILMGIGMTASGMGIAASSSTGDTNRRDRLIGQTIAFKNLLRQLIAVQPKMRTKLNLGGAINPASDYITGFLYGDACLFYAITWEALPFKQDQPTTKPSSPTRIGG